ncbi:SGNH/GDSL hydrolase family protein [Actinosynnema sp. NPDC047251]|uniref:GDSL family lipase n=1 Tax=Saccharothrix espanaensis (strain ATCC 51144 / DSM 44229 / JCM 9112 / NBRC 15066 / NRRL 15764) TaxID=1179773 RepID=K0KD71_SACES|nr:SGNH/GDSL hydrolase family protein [Saccharothrix espanaensis]CCH34739.1 GDSL family lipase [Saccharothrix espanaensis DSM 44229]
MTLRPSLLVALIATLLIPVTAQATPKYRHYVALGDSYASGPFIPDQRTDPLGCFRSTRNYASVVAAKLGPGKFTDVSCGGATTVDMTAPQGVPLGPNPPQFDALTADTDLVTLTIGGNDIGFGEIILTCARESVLDPWGAPCEQHYTAGGTDALAARIAAAGPKISAVLHGIKDRAPRAKVVVVGYLRILPPSGGCWPVVPISVGDVPYLDGTQRTLNAMIGARTTAAGATFVDPYPIGLGHDVCALPGVKWVEGLIPTAPAFPVHPNAAGMRAIGDLVARAL